MGRRKQGSIKAEGSASQLEFPWPSSPVRPPRFTLYCSNRDNERKLIIPIFAVYAAKKLVDAIVNGSNVRWLNSHELNVEDTGVTICSEELEDIVEHEYSKMQEAWELPSPYPGMIHTFVHGGRPPSEHVEVVRDENGRLPHTPDRKPRVDRTGKVGIQEIADELKMKPRDARGILRKNKVAKPEGGWMWSPDEADKIRAMLKVKDNGGDKAPVGRMK